MKTEIHTQHGIIEIQEQEEFVKITFKDWTDEKRTIFYVDDAGIPGVIGPCISFSLNQILEPKREDAMNDSSFKEGE